MKIVVTGASGHVGRALMALLEKRGHQAKGFSSRDLDLAKEESIATLRAALGPDVALVHLAAWHPPATAATTAADRRKLIDVNVMGTMRAYEAARGGHAKCVIYASTFEVYGTPQKSAIDEDHPTRPLSDYGATKLSGEDHLFAFAYEEKTRVVALRMPAICGREKTPRLLPNCLGKVARGERPVIEGDGGDLRDQLYVDDAALAIALAVEKDGVSGIFNVADGAAHSVAEVAKTAMKVAGMSGEPDVAERKKARLDYHMDTAKAARELGFTAQVSLEDGMRRQLESMR